MATGSDKGRSKTRDQENKEQVAYNFLTQRYVRWSSVKTNPRKYSHNPYTNVVLDLEKVKDKKYIEGGYINIWIQYSFPKRITETAHEPHLGVYWDTEAERYLSISALESYLPTYTTDYRQQVYYKPGHRFISLLEQPYPLVLGVKRDPLLDWYVVLNKADIDKLTDQEQALVGLAVEQYYQEEYKYLIHHPPTRKP